MLDTFQTVDMKTLLRHASDCLEDAYDTLYKSDINELSGVEHRMLRQLARALAIVQEVSSFVK